MRSNSWWISCREVRRAHGLALSCSASREKLPNTDRHGSKSPFRPTMWQPTGTCGSVARARLLAGRAITSVQEALHFLEPPALDYLQPDATIAGGITQCREIAALAASRNVGIAWHSWGAGVSLMANLHLGLATAASEYVEYCRVGSPFREDILVEPPAIIDGCLRPPDSFGLGVKITDDLLDRYPYRGVSGHSFQWDANAFPEPSRAGG